MIAQLSQHALADLPTHRALVEHYRRQGKPTFAPSGAQWLRQRA